MVRKYYYDKSGRGKFPEIFKTMDLNTSLSSSWHQTLSFKCREVIKRNNREHMSCPFFVRIPFERNIGRYVIKNVFLFVMAML